VSKNLDTGINRRLVILSNMARRVLKKLERVISTKILKADFPQIMEEVKDLHSKKIISQPTVSAFIRFAISRYRQSAQAQAKSGDVIQMLPSGITMATYEGAKPQVGFERVYPVFPNDTRVVNVGGQSGQVGFERVYPVFPNDTRVVNVGGQSSIDMVGGRILLIESLAG
jgi:hypothetical protein